MNTENIFVLFIIFLEVQSVRIVWDNDAPLEYNEIQNGRFEEIRTPNWLFIYPGTKWCGPGDIAENFYDLGEAESTDKCCRTHDFCPDYIDGYQSLHNLTNDRFHSRLHCDCDQRFYECLKSVNKRTSAIIGHLYFNGIGQQCFKKDYPIKSCLKHIYFPVKKCVRYELDQTQEQMYQWFDVPQF